MRASLAIAFVLAAYASACSSRTNDFDPCDPLYEPAGDRECRSPASDHVIEWEYGSGTICTLECEDELDCPVVAMRASRCLDVESSGEYLCYLECTLGSGGDNCPSGWVCQPLAAGGSVCLP